MGEVVFTATVILYSTDENDYIVGIETQHSKQESYETYQTVPFA